MSKVKYPQDKKRLSYSRDRRNAYGESSKGSRKSIRRNKRLSSQAERSKNAKLKSLIKRVFDSDYAVEVENDLKSAIKLRRAQGFRKYPDLPLGEYIELQKRKRAKRFGRKASAKLKRKVSF